MNTQQKQQPQSSSINTKNTINVIQNNFYFNNTNNASTKMNGDDVIICGTDESKTVTTKSDGIEIIRTTLDERKRTLTLPLDNSLLTKIKNAYPTPSICVTPHLNYSISIIETPSTDIKLPTPMVDSMISELLNQQEIGNIKESTNLSAVTQILPASSQPQIPQIDPNSFTTLSSTSMFSMQEIIKDEPQTVPTHKQAAKRARRTSTKQSSSISSTSSSPTRSSSCDNKTVTTVNGDLSEDKAELKRKRNREAARKCRTRKLEKIATLENKVQELTDKNQTILEESNKISKEIESLKAKLNEHRESHGCDLPNNL
jgi:hypothetical protein